MKNFDFVQKKGFDVIARARVTGDGVIVAQGVVTHGWALYVQNGELRFAITVNGHRSIVSTRAKPTGDVRIEVGFAINGELQIKLDGERIANEKLDGPLQSQPLDGLEVGSDSNGSVGNYDAPFELQGEVEDLIIEIR